MEVTTGAMVKSLDRAEQTREPSERGRIELVTVGQVTVGRAVFQPGWRWSDDVKPVAGTDLCEVEHIGYVVSGHERVRMADGSELTLSPGDAFLIPAGHDAWVVGDEPCVTLDFGGNSSRVGTPSAREGDGE